MGSVRTSEKEEATSVIELSGESSVHILRNWFSYSEHDFENLWSKRPKEAQHVVIFGKRFEVKRRQAFYVSKEIRGKIASYNFSGSSVPSRSIEDEALLSRALSCVRKHASKTFGKVWGDGLNAVFVNWYAEGDKIGEHSDDEKCLVANSPIYSVTMQPSSTTRRVFRIKPKRKRKRKGSSPLVSCNAQPKEKLDISLAGGDLLIMCGHFQNEFTHQVPFRKTTDKGIRINLTIRAFK